MTIQNSENSSEKQDKCIPQPDRGGLDRLFSAKEVCIAYGLDHSTLRKLIDSGQFPRPSLDLGRKLRRWRRDELPAMRPATASTHIA